jgi:hypothetical protein
VGSLFDLFEKKGFAILFVLLLGPSALPLPTGGATHVFEIIAMLLALELISGRDQIWLPRRWRQVELAGDKQRRFITALMKMIGRLERLSRPRLRFLFALVVGATGIVLAVVLGQAAINSLGRLL